ncbi:P-loop containing nucleoside triphosphate hydrolase protein [Paraphoma chrysanthemicola]|uniref:P-loop containing nucleoside triphosphate hydrolase protein n=1 Tax=Paraphoma chrysanthemicola TaxID=798071 RepID=A0A8K0RIG1_9PLEO|nr:P-loop containing nucleoside triphosphate hydrolase protein [Paraphoma chrysanthemicola]
MSTSTDLIVPEAVVLEPATDQLWPESLDTPGLIPRHLKRNATRSFPILEVLQRILHRLRPTGTAGDLEKLLALIGLYQAVGPVYKHLKDFFIWAFTSQITILEHDAVARDVLAWMSTEVIQNGRTRSAMLSSGSLDTANTSFYLPSHLTGGRAAVEPNDEKVLCLPPLGTRIFWVGFRPFLFARTGGHSIRGASSIMSGTSVNDKGQLQNSITITTLGWSLQPLQKFTEVCREYKLKHFAGTTTVYFAGGHEGSYGRGDGWQSVSKAIRKLDTIDMDDEVKSDLIRDAEYYYSERSRQYFADCGIPYRRGYLFHGPPGTGKSSFSAALAGHLKCDIYHINLASGDINDGGLHRLFLGLPRKCIVVIEDIDSTGIGREHKASKPKPKAPTTEDLSSNLATKSLPMPQFAHAYSSSKGNTVTLSGLLNAIDGNASQEGRLLIMTSNNPDALDGALIRPGRIDKKVYFGNMSKTAGKSIFMRLIGRALLAHDSAFTMAKIEKYADEFADKIPPNTFTPAEVQNFLQSCRGDPHKALQDIDAWLVENRKKPDDTKDTKSSSDSLASFVEHGTGQGGSSEAESF